MKSLAKLKKEPGIWLYDAPMPIVGPNDVLIKIKKTAICGTDIHIYNWDGWAEKTIPVPMVIGHEFVGQIAAFGDEVKGFKIGDRVSGEGHISCGFCRSCRAGKRHLCRKNIGVGVTRPGCFAEYLVIPAVNACLIPEEVSDDLAAIMDPLGNATHTALSFDLVGEDVLVTGAGPIGIMSAAIAKHVGARNVVITDLNEDRLELARKLNPKLNCLNPNKETLSNMMQKLNMKEGFDVGFEMSGDPGAFNEMLQVMNHAGKIAMLGFLPPSTNVDWSQIIMRGLIIKGIYGREMFETWYKMIAMLQSGLDVKAIITHRFPVEKFQEGFDLMRTGKSGKVILEW
jgi:threonine 3-dehydrogenase